MIRWHIVSDDTFIIACRVYNEWHVGVASQQDVLSVFDETAPSQPSSVAFKIDSETGELKRVRRIVKIELMDTLEADG